MVELSEQERRSIGIPDKEKAPKGSLLFAKRDTGRYVKIGGGASNKTYIPAGAEVYRFTDSRGNVYGKQLVIYQGRRLIANSDITRAVINAGFSVDVPADTTDPRTIERTPEGAADYRAKQARRNDPNKVVSRVIRDGNTEVRLKGGQTQVFENRTTPKDGYFIRQPNGDLVGFRSRAELRAFAVREYGEKQAQSLLSRIERNKAVAAPKVQRRDPLQFATIQDKPVADLSRDPVFTADKTAGDVALGFLADRRRKEAEVAQAVRVAKQEGTFTNDLRVANVKATYSNIFTGAATPLVALITKPAETAAGVGLEGLKFTGDVFAAIGGNPERLGRKVVGAGVAVVEQPITQLSGIAAQLALFEGAGGLLRARAAKAEVSGVNLLEVNTRADAAGSVSILESDLAVKVGGREFLVKGLGREVTGAGAKGEVSRSIFKFETAPAAGGEAVQSLQIGKGQRVGSGAESVAIVEYTNLVPKGKVAYKDIAYKEPAYAFTPAEVATKGAGLDLTPNVFTGVRPKSVDGSTGVVKIVSEEIGAVDGLAVTRFQTFGKEGGKLTAGEGVIRDVLKVDDVTRSEALAVDIKGASAKNVYSNRFTNADDLSAEFLRNNPKNPLSAEALANRKTDIAFNDNLAAALKDVVKTEGALKADVFGLAVEGSKKAAQKARLSEIDLAVGGARPVALTPIKFVEPKIDTKAKARPVNVREKPKQEARSNQDLGLFTPVKVGGADRSRPIDLTGGKGATRSTQKRGQRGGILPELGALAGVEPAQVNKGAVDVAVKSGQLQGEVQKPRAALSSVFDFPTRPITPPKTPVLPRLSVPRRKGGGGVFSALVRRRGRFESIGAFSSAEEATRRAALFVKGTSAASFKIEKDGEDVKSEGGLFGFRRSKRDPNVFVELSKFRIDTAGELREITFKGARRRRFI